MAGIYIHIPFCKQACHYCDFHFSTDLKEREKLINALIKEISLQKDYLNKQNIKTVYFGGGTPSLLNEKELNSILESINKNFQLNLSPEITLEANPDDLTLDKLKGLYKSGINRLSIGIQSFNDAALKYLNRAHSSDEAYQCLEKAREVGFDNLSLDLIYAIPINSTEQWEDDLRQIVDLDPEHISAYCLTIEERTAFGNWLKKGRLKPVDEDIAAQQFEGMVKYLGGNGYEQYEISNFCRDGQYAQHNTNYWKHIHYLGIGPSAHSYNGKSRQFNIRNNTKYVRLIEGNKVPYELDNLSEKDRVNEYILTSLRTKWGTDCHWLLKNYHYDLLEKQKNYIQYLEANGLAIIHDHRLKLTDRGKLLADKITYDFFIE